jgi:hypothetical protein
MLDVQDFLLPAGAKAKTMIHVVTAAAWKAARGIAADRTGTKGLRWCAAADG